MSTSIATLNLRVAGDKAAATAIKNLEGNVKSLESATKKLQSVTNKHSPSKNIKKNADIAAQAAELEKQLLNKRTKAYWAFVQNDKRARAVESANAQKSLQKRLTVFKKEKAALEKHNDAIARAETAAARKIELALKQRTQAYWNAVKSERRARQAASADAQKNLQKRLSIYKKEKQAAERKAAAIVSAEKRQQKAMGSFSVSANAMARGFGIISAAAVGFAAAAKLAFDVDKIQSFENRLRLLTETEKDVGKLKGQLFDIANASRVGFQATAEFYARAGLASKELGVSQEELLKLSDMVNKSIAMSGATTREASMALIQFSQGLASGTLRGDELRSVLEQLPALADHIAAGLGVTRGELRSLGAEGKLTAKEVFNAILSQQDKVEQQFSRFIPNAAQGWQVFYNGATEAGDALNKLFGISTKLGSTAETTGNFLGTLAEKIHEINTAVTNTQAEQYSSILERMHRALKGIEDRDPKKIKEAISAVLEGASTEELRSFMAHSEELRSRNRRGRAWAGGGNIDGRSDEEIQAESIIRDRNLAAGTNRISSERAEPEWVKRAEEWENQAIVEGMTSQQKRIKAESDAMAEDIKKIREDDKLNREAKQRLIKARTDLAATIIQNIENEKSGKSPSAKKKPEDFEYTPSTETRNIHNPAYVGDMAMQFEGWADDIEESRKAEMEQRDAELKDRQQYQDQMASFFERQQERLAKIEEREQVASQQLRFAHEDRALKDRPKELASVRLDREMAEANRRAGLDKTDSDYLTRSEADLAIEEAWQRYDEAMDGIAESTNKATSELEGFLGQIIDFDKFGPAGDYLKKGLASGLSNIFMPDDRRKRGEAKAKDPTGILTKGVEMLGEESENTEDHFSTLTKKMMGTGEIVPVADDMADSFHSATLEGQALPGTISGIFGSIKQGLAGLGSVGGGIFGSIGGLIGGSTGSSIGGLFDSLPFFHDGGKVTDTTGGRVFGLSEDERLAVLEVGETVIPKKENEGNTNRTQPPHRTEVNIYNYATNTEVEEQQDITGEVTNIIIRDLSTRGRIGRAIENNYGARRPPR